MICLVVKKMWQLKSNLQVKLLRAELEDQEKSLKASVAAQVQNDLFVGNKLQLVNWNRRKKPTRTGLLLDKLKEDSQRCFI